MRSIKALLLCVLNLAFVGGCASERAPLQSVNPVLPPSYSYLGTSHLQPFAMGCVALLDGSQCGGEPKEIFADHCVNGYTLRKFTTSNAEGVATPQGTCSERVVATEIDCNRECELLGSIMGICSTRAVDCFGKMRTASSCACE